MSDVTAQNKALLQAIFEVFNTGNVHALDELVAADVIDHEAFPGATPGLDGLKQFIALFRHAFPDLQCQVKDMIAEGDKVYSYVTMQGTQQGAFLHIPATGRTIDVPSVEIVRFDQGKAVEHWAVTDTLTMFQQLGVIPEEEAGLPGGDGAPGEATQNQAALIPAIYDAFNERRFEYTAGLMAPEAVMTNVATGQRFTGPEGMQAFLSGWAAAFPDAQVEVTNAVEGRDHVVIEFTARGTHTGPLQTSGGILAPTNRSVEIRFCDVWRVQGGRILEGRTYFDLMTMLHQLGVIPVAESV